MPITKFTCPNCGGHLHTDDLLEGECVTPNCGHQFPEDWYRQMYEEEGMNPVYIPSRDILEGNDE